MSIIKFLYRIVIKDINYSLLDLIYKMQVFDRKSRKSASNSFKHKIFSSLASYYRNKIYYKYHCDIHPSCKLGDNIGFRHPIGIVIGAGTEIKDNVTILQQTTFGSVRFDNMGFGMPYRQVIGKNCIIGAGAKILGDITIGNNCVIGANSVITKDIPDNCTVVGFNKIINNNENSKR